jgi:SEC-C motif-containing protein
MITLCPCGSNKLYKECCEPLHQGSKLANSPLELMRSRYCAYVLGEVDYILATTDSSTRSYYSRSSIESWSKETTWLGLEIISHSTDRVQFIATFREQNGAIQEHREDSLFRKRGKKWYFVDGRAF